MKDHRNRRDISPVSRARKRQRPRWWASLLGVTTILGALTVGSVSPVQASDNDFDRTSRLGIAVGPNEGPAGPRVTVPNGKGRYLHLGAVLSPLENDDNVAWCIQLELTRPDVGAQVSTSTVKGEGRSPYPELQLSVPQAAWLLSQYPHGGDAWTNAAVATLMHVNFEEDTAEVAREAVVEEIVSSVKAYESGKIFDTAVQLVAAARAETPMAVGELRAVGNLSVTVDDSAATRSGVVTDVGAKDSVGSWIGGVSLRAVLDGPAAFDATGSKEWVGTSDGAALTLPWTATGNGDVTVSISAENVPAPFLTKYTAGQETQNTVMYPSAGEHSIPGSDVTFPVVTDFQPVLVSDVGASRIASQGETLSDTVTISADPRYSNPSWISIDGNPVPILFRGTAYGTGATPPKESSAIPDDAVSIGTVELRAEGPGTYTAEIPGSNVPGFVTWVWTMDVADQGDYQYLVAADWSDSFGMPQENTSVRHPVSIDTSLYIRVTQSGTYLVDDVFVTGFPADHPRFAGDGVFGADTQEMIHTLYFFPEGSEVSEDNLAQASLIGETRIPARNGYHGAVGSTDFFVGSEPEPGTYVFVTSFEGDDRVEPIRTSVTDVTEQFVIAPRIPTVKTELTGEEGEKIIALSDKPVTLIDTVCYEGLTGGQEYVLTGTLMDQKTAEAILRDGAPLTSTTVFVPEASDGCAEVSFEVDSQILAGATVVAFEAVTQEGRTIAAHADIDDEAQTVTFEPPAPESPAPSPSPTLPPSHESPQAGEELPRTGLTVIPLAVLSIGALAAGIITMRVSRRSSL